MSDEQIKSLGKAITRQHAVAEQLAARVMQMDEVNAELLKFAQEVRRAGDTLLANMAIAAIAIAKLAIETPAEVSPARAAPASTLKPHVFRELVNDLRDLAKEFHGHDSLRDRISGRLAQDVPVVGPCQGHAVQQDADEVIAKRMQEARMKHDADPSTWRSFGALGFKCHACLDTGFLMKPMIAPEPPDVKCPNGCRSKKGGA